MTRIVAGTHGGRRITAPSGRDTRPTADRVREALFSTLDSLTDVSGARFADLYAGSGAVGLEAASRGAATVLLVESDARAARTIRANIAALDLGATCSLLAVRVASALATPPPAPFEVIFADPPYAMPDQEVTDLLRDLVRHEWLAPEGVVAVERSARSPEPVAVEGVTSERGRRYGETALWYFRRS